MARVVQQGKQVIGERECWAEPPPKIFLQGVSLVKKSPILPRGKTAWGVAKWVLVIKTEGENSNPRCIDLSCGDKHFATARGAWTGAH